MRKTKFCVLVFCVLVLGAWCADGPSQASGIIWVGESEPPITNWLGDVAEAESDSESYDAPGPLLFAVENDHDPGGYTPRWSVVGGDANIRNHVSGYPHFIDTTGKTDAELFRLHDQHHDQIGPVSASQISAYYAVQSPGPMACPDGLCPVPGSSSYAVQSPGPMACPNGLCPVPGSSSYAVQSPGPMACPDGLCPVPGSSSDVLVGGYAYSSRSSYSYSASGRPRLFSGRIVNRLQSVRAQRRMWRQNRPGLFGRLLRRHRSGGCF